MNPHIRISFCIPVYNAEATLTETLESIRRQNTNVHYQVIVVDDGSTDSSKRIAMGYCDRFENFQYLYITNGGPGRARNHAIVRAQGEYLVFLDSDDILEPDYIFKMLSIAEARPDLDIVSPNARLFGLEQYEGKLFQDMYPSTRPVTHSSVLTGEANIFITSLVRKEAVIRAGGFRENLWGAEDLDLWLRILEEGQADFTEEVLVRYRKSATSLSTPNARLFNHVLQVLRTTDAVVPSSDVKEKLMARIHKIECDRDFHMGKKALRERDWVEAHRCLKASLAYRVKNFPLRETWKHQVLEVITAVLSASTKIWNLRQEPAK